MKRFTRTLFAVLQIWTLACSENVQAAEKPLQPVVAEQMFRQLQQRLPRVRARMLPATCRRAFELGELDFLIDLATQQVEDQSQLVAREKKTDWSDMTKQRLETKLKLLQAELASLQQQRKQLHKQHLAGIRRETGNLEGRQESASADVLLKLLQQRKPVFGPSAPTQ